MVDDQYLKRKDSFCNFRTAKSHRFFYVVEDSDELLYFYITKSVIQTPQQMNTSEFQYRTLSHQGEGMIREKGSRFIGIARCVDSEKSAETFLSEVKAMHPKARHHCYAYRIGHPEILKKANDDGEPSGTAGRPILGQLIKMDVTNTMIIVVRYFGGTLLGTSGLIQAYKGCAEAALADARITQIIEKEVWLIEIEFAIVHLLEEWAPRLDFNILEREHIKTRMLYTMEIDKKISRKSRLELIGKLLSVYTEEVDLEQWEYDQFQMEQLS